MMGEEGFRKCQDRWSEDAHMEIYFRVLTETARRKFGFVPWEGDSQMQGALPLAGTQA